MRLKPNDSPVMELNEKRTFTFKLDPAVGANTLSSPEVTSPQLTVGTASVSGKSISASVTASRTGTHMIKAQCSLSSGEIVVGVIRVKVVDSTQETNQDCDYGRC